MCWYLFFFPCSFSEMFAIYCLVWELGRSYLSHRAYHNHCCAFFCLFSVLHFPHGRHPPYRPLALLRLCQACCHVYSCSHSVAGPSSLRGVNLSLAHQAPLLLGTLRVHMWRSLPVIRFPNWHRAGLVVLSELQVISPFPHWEMGLLSRGRRKRGSCLSRLWITLPAPLPGLSGRRNILEGGDCVFLLPLNPSETQAQGCLSLPKDRKLQ